MNKNLLTTFANIIAIIIIICISVFTFFEHWYYLLLIQVPLIIANAYSAVKYFRKYCVDKVKNLNNSGKYDYTLLNLSKNHRISRVYFYLHRPQYAYDEQSLLPFSFIRRTNRP